MSDETPRLTPAEEVLCEYSARDVGDDACSIDHESMACEIVRLRRLREMTIDYVLDQADFDKTTLLRVLMHPPEVAS